MVRHSAWLRRMQMEAQSEDAIGRQVRNSPGRTRTPDVGVHSVGSPQLGACLRQFVAARLAHPGLRSPKPAERFGCLRCHDEVFSGATLIRIAAWRLNLLLRADTSADVVEGPIRETSRGKRPVERG